MRTLPTRQSGQMIPIFAMVIFSGMMLLIAAVNVYRVTKAKLAAQNIADAVALTVASLQAKDINVTIDRNEWLNHMYAGDTTGEPDPECNRFPPISMTQQGRWWTDRKCEMDPHKAEDYMTLIKTINDAQDMFHAAYNRFMGADDASGTLPSSNMGQSSLNDILSEIDGINDGQTQVVVFNTDTDAMNAESKAKQMAELNKSNLKPMSNINPTLLKPVPFKVEEVHIKVKDRGDRTLTQLYNEAHPNAHAEKPIGLRRPDWESSGSGLTVNTATGKVTTIGAGAIAIRKVDLIFPLIRSVSVKAQARAYVVKESGYSWTKDKKPPKTFRPTYYVKLGNPS